MTTDIPITSNDHAWELTALSPVLGDLTIPITPSLNASLTIGRHTDNDVVLAVPQVSRRHAQFNQVGQHLYLQDLNSANGTFVNGQRIGSEAIEVTANTEIGFADLLFVLSLNKPFSASVADVENLAFAENPLSSPTHSTANPATIDEIIAPEKIVSETVTPTATPVSATPVPTTPTVTPTVAKPTVTASPEVAPIITAPVEPQTISPITTTASSVVENKNPASKNMWLIAIVIILIIAGLVIAKMVL